MPNLPMLMFFKRADNYRFILVKSEAGNNMIEKQIDISREKGDYYFYLHKSSLNILGFHFCFKLSLSLLVHQAGKISFMK